MTQPHILALLDKLSTFEGSIPWMYLDTVGKVTVAVGLMLPDVQSAVALPFQFAGATAEPGDIRADFLRVEKMAMGKVPGFYHSETSPTLGRDVMQSLLIGTLNNFVAELHLPFPDFDSYPEIVKPALLDMCYNLGLAGLEKKYPIFCDAVRNKKWSEAAANCHRRQVNDQRNAWTAQQFLEVPYVQ